jgi:hypothetical protein
LPKLRTRWTRPAAGDPVPGQNLSGAAARALLRNLVTRAAERASGEADFFGLRTEGVRARLRFSDADLEQVSGAVRGRLLRQCRLRAARSCPRAEPAMVISCAQPRD